MTPNELKTQKAKQKVMIAALKKNFGNITVSSKSAGIERQTHYNWIKDCPDYKEDFDNIDFDDLEYEYVHAALLSRIPKSDNLIKFYLEKKGKKQGYGDDVHVKHSVDERSTEEIIKNIERLKAITGTGE